MTGPYPVHASSSLADGSMTWKDPEARRKWERVWYQKHKKRRSDMKRSRRKNLKEKLDAYKRGLKCSHCPESDPDCLQFHHRDPGLKDFAIGGMTRLGAEWSTVLAEIEKCLVLCANCHIKEHVRLKRLSHISG